MKFGKSVWWAKRLNEENAEVAEYDKPIEIVTRPNYFSVMPATARGYLAILQFGETISDTWTAIANNNYFENQFKKGDVMWVDGAKPDEIVDTIYGNGASANAVIKNAVEVNTTINITLERNQNQVKNEN